MKYAIGSFLCFYDHLGISRGRTFVIRFDFGGEVMMEAEEVGGTIGVFPCV
jgi:hypothetical protein